MKAHSIIRGLLFCIVAALLSCGGPSDDAIRDAVSRYYDGNVTSQKELEELIFRRIEKSTIDHNNISVTDTFIYVENNGDLDIIYPTSRTLDNIGKYEFIYVTLSADRLAYTDGQSIYCCDETDEPLYTADDKNSIKSLMIIDDNIFFFKDYQLFRVSIETKQAERVVHESFSPPYRKLFNVTLKHADSFIGISTGIAGSYNISIINYKERSVKLSNIRSASSSFDLNGDSIWYLGGSTGNWELAQIDFASRKKRILYRMSDINNLVISAKGYIFENSKGIHVSDYSQDPIALPVRFRLMGNCGDAIVIKYNSIILSDFDRIKDIALLINESRKHK